jgi:hypothetical protein
MVMWQVFMGEAHCQQPLPSLQPAHRTNAAVQHYHPVRDCHLCPQAGHLARRKMENSDEDHAGSATRPSLEGRSPSALGASGHLADDYRGTIRRYE